MEVAVFAYCAMMFGYLIYGIVFGLRAWWDILRGFRSG